MSKSIKNYKGGSVNTWFGIINRAAIPVALLTLSGYLTKKNKKIKKSKKAKKTKRIRKKV